MAKKVCIVGSGNWGSAIAKIIGKNCAQYDDFDTTVNMYVYEEMVDGRKLTEIINESHENVKYLPGHKIPHNVVAIPDLKTSVTGADILIFVVPHQFVRGLCAQMKGCIKQGAIGLSLIKGIDSAAGTGKLSLISSIIHEQLNIECSVLMGANLAPEVADEKFCETTIGCRNAETGVVLKKLIQAPFFRVTVVTDAHTVEICGALKNIVAVGAGFVDGLGYGDNTKAAVIRLGLMEMIKFGEVFYDGCQMATYFESCGIADLITTCYGGRNRRVAEAFAKTRKTLEELEKEMLNGQKLQGPATAKEIYGMLKGVKQEDKFPLFTAIYRVCYEKLAPEEMVECLKKHPEHM